MKKKRVTAFILATMMFSASAAGAQAAGTNTWKYQNNHWYYINSSGKAATGWVQYKGDWYFFANNGVMQTGWIRSNGRWYFLDKSSGKMRTGWLKDQNSWYYLKSDGVMATGWVNDHNHRYFLEKSGIMVTGWMEDQGKKYYLNPSGEMVTGQKYIDEKPYVFTASGALSTDKLTGWFRDGSIVMYFNQDGSIHTGWLTDDNKKYYFDQNGFIHRGWLSDNNQKYFFAQDGTMQTGWITEGNNRYYLDANGTMQTGWLTDGGKKYYLGTNGAMVKGWLQDQNQWYYLNSSGIMVTGWVLSNKKWYYMDNDGTMHTGWLTDRGTTYYLNDNGDMQVGWLTLGNNTYYFNSSGKMVTGKQVIGGKTYNFYDDGTLNTGPVVTKTQYNISLQNMLNVEMGLSTPPQTDLYQSHPAYVSSQYVLQDATDPTKGVVTASALNVREDTNNTAFIYGTLTKGTQVSIVSTVGTWYQIKYGTWRNAKSSDVINYLDPSKISPGSPQYLEFLLLNKYAGTTAADLNANVLAGKGILAGLGAAFIKASQQNNVNEIYLIAHALLETGNGTSKLANGVQLDTVNGQKLDKPVTVYNMFGIGAFDSCPDSCGAQTAYNNGWFTPEAAIIGGAAFIGSSYINNPTTQQNTLYKMRWNPANPGNHQYATDMSWAFSQVNTIKKIYDSLSSYTLYFDIPVYK